MIPSHNGFQGLWRSNNSVESCSTSQEEHVINLLICSLVDGYGRLFLLDKVALILRRKDRSTLVSYLILINQMPSVCRQRGEEVASYYYTLQSVTSRKDCTKHDVHQQSLIVLTEATPVVPGEANIMVTGL